MPILEYGPRNFGFFVSQKDRSIDRSIDPRASTFVPLGFVSTVSYGEGEREKEKEKKKREEEEKGSRYRLALPKSGLISNFSFPLFSLFLLEPSRIA